MKINETIQTVENIYGLIRSVTYRSSDGWASFSISASTPYTEELKNKLQYTINCTGTLPAMVDTGDEVTLTGAFEESKKYGRQFKCEAVVPRPPDVKSADGVTKLLQRLPGIGPTKAKQAVKKHGFQKAWEIAQTDPELLGVGIQQKEEALLIIKSLTVDYEALVYLLGIGLTDYQANKIIAAYGKQTIETISTNPYLIMGTISGFGFKRADMVAIKAGITLDNKARIMACVQFVLDDSEKNEGNTWIYGKKLCAIVLTTLEESAMANGIPLLCSPSFGDVRNAVYELNDEGLVIIDKKKRVFSAELRKAEDIILQVV